MNLEESEEHSLADFLNNSFKNGMTDCLEAVYVIQTPQDMVSVKIFMNVTKNCSYGPS